MRTNSLFVVSAVLVAAGSAVASADTVNATYTGVAPGEGVNLVLAGNPIGTTAGAFNWTRDLGNPGTLAGFSPTFTTFCIDLTQTVSPGTLYNMQTFPAASAPTSGAAGPGGMGAAREALLGRLFADHYNSLSSADQYAGFQLAVWEIVFDSGLDLSLGNFTATGSVSAMANANAYLGTIAGPGPSWPVFAIDDVPDGQSIQGQIMIPTPGAAALMGLGGLAAFRRRRA